MPSSPHAIPPAFPPVQSEAAIQHDWARWCHSQWLSSSSGALRRLGLADDLADSVWALGVVSKGRGGGRFRSRRRGWKREVGGRLTGLREAA